MIIDSMLKTEVSFSFEPNFLRFNFRSLVSKLVLFRHSVFVRLRPNASQPLEKVNSEFDLQLGVSFLFSWSPVSITCVPSCQSNQPMVFGASLWMPPLHHNNHSHSHLIFFRVRGNRPGIHRYLWKKSNDSKLDIQAFKSKFAPQFRVPHAGISIIECLFNLVNVLYSSS